MTTIRALAAIAAITGPYLAGVALRAGIVIAAATLLVLLGCAAPAVAGWLLRDVPGWPAELLRQRFGVKPPRTDADIDQQQWAEIQAILHTPVAATTEPECPVCHGTELDDAKCTCKKGGCGRAWCPVPSGDAA